MSRSSKVFDALRLRIPASLDAVLPAEAVAEKIASLNAIRGGWVAHALGVSKSIDDDDEDLEEDDEVLHDTCMEVHGSSSIRW